MKIKPLSEVIEAAKAMKPGESISLFHDGENLVWTIDKRIVGKQYVGIEPITLDPADWPGEVRFPWPF